MRNILCGQMQNIIIYLYKNSNILMISQIIFNFIYSTVDIILLGGR